MARTLRILVDTSVIGGCMDPEFAADSRRVLHLADSGHLILLLSEVTLRELAHAPVAIRNILPSLDASHLETVSLSDEALALRDAYLSAGVLSSRWRDDAMQVATAAVARADAIVSWNFRHIVRLDRIRAFNQVNLAEGYGILTILSPKEVAVDDDDEEKQSV